MRDFNLFNGITITVEETGESYHSYRDWALYVANNDPIGDPKQYTNYIEVPGRDGKIDISEAVSGRPIFLSREINIWLAGIRNITRWDSIISGFRNRVDGKICQIIFDTDPGYFWRGRVAIKDFKPKYEFGKFCLSLPEADPYKYNVETSAEPWKWDPFNFETGVISETGAVVITGSGTVTIPHGYMLTTPNILVSNKQSGTFTVTYDGETYDLQTGSNYIPALMVGGEDDITLTFTGSATVQVVYRGGSL